MIVTDTLQYIPFRHLTRVQVAELMGKSVSAVDYYVRRGAKICQGYTVKLPRQKNGTYLTSDVIDFLTKTNNKK